MLSVRPLVIGWRIALLSAFLSHVAAVPAWGARDGPNPQPNRPWAIGILPASIGIAPQHDPLRRSLEAALDIELSRLPNATIVERGRTAMFLDELKLSQSNRRDLKVGQIVGAEVLIRCALLPAPDAIRAKLTAVETATGNILHQVDREIHDANESLAISREFIAGLSTHLVRRPGAVDVAILPISFVSPLGADVGLSESIQRRLAARISGMPHIRVLDRDLGEFVLQESALAAAGLQDPARRSAPVAGMIVVQGTLTQKIVQGRPLDESLLSLHLTVQFEKHASPAPIEITMPLRDAANLEALARRRLRKAISALLGESTGDKTTTNRSAPAPMANADDTANNTSRFWQTQRYLLEAQRLLNDAKASPANRRSDAVAALEQIVRAAALMPSSPKPYELLTREPIDTFMEDSKPDANAADRARIAALRRQFIDSFPEHPWWASAVSDELEVLDDLAAQNPARSADSVALARRFAGAVIDGRAFAIGDDGFRAPADSSARTILDPAAVVRDITDRLMEAGDIDTAWRMCIASLPAVDAARHEPTGWEVINEFAAMSIRVGHFDAAWHAAEAQQQMYPGYPVDYLGPSAASGRLLRDHLQNAGGADRWQPLFDQAANRKHSPFDSEQFRHVKDAANALRQQTAPLPGLHEIRFAPALAAAVKETASKKAADGIVAISAEGLTAGATPWAIVHHDRREVFWQVGSDHIVTPRGLPELAPGSNKHRGPALAAFSGALYVTSADGSLYRVDPDSGVATRAAGGMPPGRVVELLVVGDALYACGSARTAGAAKAKPAKHRNDVDTGFIARLERNAARWTVWLAPDDCGPVDHVDPAEGSTLRCFHDATQRISLFSSVNSKWTAERRFNRRLAQPNHFAATSGLGLGWTDFDRAYLQNAASQTAETVASLSERFSPADHANFWKEPVDPNLPPLAAPFAGRPMGVQTESTRLWVLDSVGGLTAIDAERGFAGPFAVASAGVSMCRGVGRIFVNTGHSVVGVPLATLDKVVDEPTAWRQGQQVFANTRERLEHFARGLPPLERGLYLLSVGRSDLAEPAFAEIAGPPGTTGMSTRLEALRLAGHGEIALGLIDRFVDAPAAINDETIEAEVLQTLQAAHQWQRIATFLPRLWKESPLRGKPVDARRRTATYLVALKQILSPDAYVAERAAIAAGKLPETPWPWDANPVCRFQAKTIRETARLAK